MASIERLKSVFSPLKMTFRFFLALCLLIQHANVFGQVEISNSKQIDLYQALDIQIEERNVYTQNTFYFTLINSSDTDIDGVITLNKGFMKADTWKTSGQVRAHNSTKLSVSLSPRAEIEVEFTLTELDRLNPKGFDLYWKTLENHEREQAWIYISQAFFIGIYTFLCLFNFLLFFTTKWKIYYKYAIYILLVVIYFLYYFGFLSILFPFVDSISINHVASLYSIIFVSYFIFIRELGNYKSSAPKADFYLKVGIIYKSAHILLEIVLYSFIAEVMFTSIYKSVFLLFEVTLMLMIMIHIIKARDFRGKIVIYGSSILIVSAILVQLDIDINRAYLLELGILAELLLFSLSLGYISRMDYVSKIQNRLLYIKQLEINEQLLSKTEKELEEKVRKRTEELENAKHELEVKNKENEILLREIHHRVKNNLQMITSLLNMQQRRLQEESAKKVLMLTKNRVKTIALIHEYLYKHDDFSKIDLEAYVEELVFILIDSLHRGSKKIATSLEVESLKVDIDIAIPIGIILNELITNSIKYAFQSHAKPSLVIKLAESEHMLILEVIDNGQGMKESSGAQGFGNTIIRVLLENYEGVLEYPDVDAGFCARVKLKNFKMESKATKISSLM